MKELTKFVLWSVAVMAFAVLVLGFSRSQKAKAGQAATKYSNPTPVYPTTPQGSFNYTNPNVKTGND